MQSIAKLLEPPSRSLDSYRKCDNFFRSFYLQERQTLRLLAVSPEGNGRKQVLASEVGSHTDLRHGLL